jgi:ketosteroid isomerase-like protein
MKRLIFSLVILCLLFSAAQVQAQTWSAAEKEVVQAIDNCNAAYNAHDTKAFVALRTEDYEDWVGTTKGREARAKDLTGTFERQKSIRAKQLEEIGINFVTPDVAIYKQRIEVTGSVDGDGKPLPPARSLAAGVWVKQGGRWLESTFFSRPIEE